MDQELEQPKPDPLVYPLGFSNTPFEWLDGMTPNQHVDKFGREVTIQAIQNYEEECRRVTAKESKMKGVIPELYLKEIVNVPLVVYIDAEGNMTDASDKREGVTRHIVGEAVVNGNEVSMTLADRVADEVLDSLLTYPSNASFGLPISDEPNPYRFNPTPNDAELIAKWKAKENG